MYDPKSISTLLHRFYRHLKEDYVPEQQTIHMGQREQSLALTLNKHLRNQRDVRLWTCGRASRHRASHTDQTSGRNRQPNNCGWKYHHPSLWSGSIINKTDLLAVSDPHTWKK